MVSVYSAPYREERTGDEWYTPMGPTDGKRWAPHRAPAVPRSGDDGHSQGHTDGNDGHPQGPHGRGTMGTPNGSHQGARRYSNNPGYDPLTWSFLLLQKDCQRKKIPSGTDNM